MRPCQNPGIVLCQSPVKHLVQPFSFPVATPGQTNRMGCQQIYQRLWTPILVSGDDAMRQNLGIWRDQVGIAMAASLKA